MNIKGSLGDSCGLAAYQLLLAEVITLLLISMTYMSPFRELQVGLQAPS